MALRGTKRANTRRYRQWRAGVLAKGPLCHRCQGKGFTVAATDLHHVIPLSRGGSVDGREERGTALRGLPQGAPRGPQEGHPNHARGRSYLCRRDTGRAFTR